MELMLKEKDFRASMQEIRWEDYQDKIVAVTCTSDAIIPIWAYMLVASYLQPFAKEVIFGNEGEAAEKVLVQRINAINVEQFVDKRVVVKGCGDLPIKEAAYMAITMRLRSVAKSIMYGEPCSTVPVYKKK
jgi:hypothetical protein